MSAKTGWIWADAAAVIVSHHVGATLHGGRPARRSLFAVAPTGTTSARVMHTKGMHGLDERRGPRAHKRGGRWRHTALAHHRQMPALGARTGRKMTASRPIWPGVRGSRATPGGTAGQADHEANRRRPQELLCRGRLAL